MVRRWEWVGERGERGGVGVGDSRKLRRLYIFLGEFVSVNLVVFFNVRFLFKRMECIHWDECPLPPFYMKRVGKKRREKKIGK